MTKRNIWVEKLALLDALILVSHSLFAGIIVRYDKNNISPAAKRLINILRKLNLRKNFVPAKLSLEKKDAQGYALNYRLERNIDTCLQGLCDECFSHEEDFLKKVTKSYFAFYLFYRFTFVTMVEEEPEFKNCSKNIFYLVRHPLNSALIAFYKEKGYSLKESVFSLDGLWYYLRPCYHFLSVVLAQCRTQKEMTNILNIKPSIWIEYCHNEHLDFAFWKGSVKTDDFDVVYYLDRRDSFSFSVMTQKIEKFGFKWIDLRFSSLAKFANLKVSDIAGLIKIFFSHSAILLKIFKVEYEIWFLLYREVFKRFKVKVFIQHQEASWIQGPQSKAIESSIGIMLGFHWSGYLYYKEPIYLNPQHVYFVWGEVVYDCMRKRKGMSRYILPSGLWIAATDNDKQEYLDNFRKNNAFIVSIFDSSVAYNIYQAPDTLSQFYLSNLKLLADNPNWGAIVKSKDRELNDFFPLPNGEEIVSKMNLLIKQNRLLVCKPNFSPVTVASYSDLSVCYGINSAGIIAGVYGYRAIHWDCSGWLHHPFYRDSRQNFVYTILEEIEKCIVKVSRGDQNIGDFSRWRQKYNYFNDYDAHKRVGEFIRLFLDEIIQTEDLEHSLDFSIRKYNEINRIGESFLSADSYWEDEQLNAVDRQ